MFSRRGILAAGGSAVFGFGMAACAGGGGTAGASSTPAPSGAAASARTFDAEWGPHERTFMSWPTESIWFEDVDDVRDDIAGVARAIADYEEVVMLASPGEEDEAEYQCGKHVIVETMPVDDLWARDTVPVFISEDEEVKGVDLNFNGWGDKQVHSRDQDVARSLLSKFGIPRIATDLVAEGGSLETDGEGTLLLTESSVLNDNRNPGWTRDDIEAELKTLLGVTTVIWFDGVYGKDITDAHIDSLVRFVAPGVVLLDTPGPGTPPDVWSKSSDQARRVLGDATDAAGRSFEIIDLQQPDPYEIRGTEDDFLSSYVNFYIGNDAVYLPQFGDRKADKNAQRILGEQFPDRDIVPLDIDVIASGGGGIHCATHDMPRI
ncbi:agmatine deiminase family protein [Brevibacterium sp. NPDC059310]|uniref:agmatine deiminase family protein n=1 Tax=Brevibacterium sp. NPDC059310 TaxID=3346802 RepID=UPI00366B892D